MEVPPTSANFQQAGFNIQNPITYEGMLTECWGLEVMLSVKGPTNQRLRPQPHRGSRSLKSRNLSVTTYHRLLS